MQPDVEIVSATTVEFDPSFPEQSDVEVISATTVEYTAPASTGGQPDVVVITETTVEYEAPSIYADIEGDTEIVFLVQGELSLEIDPVPVPFTVDQEDFDIVSITMPVPEDFDQFGRPQ